MYNRKYFPTSGAMCCSVPQIVLVLFLLPTFFDSPKSDSSNLLPHPETRTFSGLTSLCTTPRSCTNRTAEVSWAEASRSSRAEERRAPRPKEESSLERLVAHRGRSR